MIQGQRFTELVSEIRFYGDSKINQFLVEQSHTLELILAAHQAQRNIDEGAVDQLQAWVGAQVVEKILQNRR